MKSSKLKACLIFSTFALFPMWLFAQSRLRDDYPHLCNEDERVAFTCMAKQKNISLCVSDWPQTPSYDYQCSTEIYGEPGKSKAPSECQWNFKNWNKGRMTYRFGTPAKLDKTKTIELEFPPRPTPLKKAFGMAALKVKNLTKDVVLGLDPRTVSNKRAAEKIRIQSGVELLNGIYQELWFFRGDYRYTFFSQNVEYPSKALSGAGVVVEKNSERIASFVCDDTDWALEGEIWHPDGFRRSFARYANDFSVLFHGRDQFKHESDSFRGVSPLLDSLRRK